MTTKKEKEQIALILALNSKIVEQLEILYQQTQNRHYQMDLSRHLSGMYGLKDILLGNHADEEQ